MGSLGQPGHQDFEDFDTANEDDELEEFLGLARRFPKVAPPDEFLLLRESRWRR